jgi:hypothetical protein
MMVVELLVCLLSVLSQYFLSLSSPVVLSVNQYFGPCLLL